MSDFFLSVIIPTYNRAYIVGDAIESVLNQNFADIEVVVVDDGSTDNTAELCKKYEGERFQYLLMEKNGGVSAARNLGIEKSLGKYVSFVDSDDYVTEDYFTLLCKYAKFFNPDIVVRYRSEYIHDKLSDIEEFAYDFIDTNDLSVYVDRVTGGLFRREFLDQHQLWFPVGVNYTEDTYFMYMAQFLSDIMMRVKVSGKYKVRSNRKDNQDRLSANVDCSGFVSTLLNFADELLSKHTIKEKWPLVEAYSRHFKIALNEQHISAREFGAIVRRLKSRFVGV